MVGQLEGQLTCKTSEWWYGIDADLTGARRKCLLCRSGCCHKHVRHLLLR